MSEDDVEAVARALAQADLRADEQPVEEVIFKMRVEGWKPKARSAIVALKARGWQPPAAPNTHTHESRGR